MGRLVYSFSLPEDCDAAWQLREWKKEGRVLSHVIQTSIETTGRECDRIQKDLKWHQTVLKRTTLVLQDIFGVDVNDFVFVPQGSSKLSPFQPIETLEIARQELNKRTEFTIAKSSQEQWMAEQQEPQTWSPCPAVDVEE